MVKQMAEKGFWSFKVRLEVVLCRVYAWGSLWSPLRGLSVEGVGSGGCTGALFACIWKHLQELSGLQGETETNGSRAAGAWRLMGATANLQDSVQGPQMKPRLSRNELPLCTSQVPYWNHLLFTILAVCNDLC